MIEEFSERLLRKIDERRRALADGLSSGGASDYPDYRDRAGRIRSLDEMRPMIMETIKEFRDDDD